MPELIHKTYVHKEKHGLCYQVCGPKGFFVYSDKKDLQNKTEGDIVRVGYPNLHNVYRVGKDNGLNFQYHFNKVAHEKKNY